MNEAKHTPGPWRVTRADDLPIAIVAPDADLGSVGVAKIVILNDHEANAKLIAAAPALLAALQAFIPELEQRERFISANDSPWSQSERDMLNRISAARKAVKDAGGEA